MEKAVESLNYNLRLVDSLRFKDHGSLDIGSPTVDLQVGSGFKYWI